MARVTIVGAGITGMAIASVLSRNHEITIVAKNLPGDEPSIEWASPWAGACFLAGGCATREEEKMQRDSFAELWRLSVRYPESSVRRITIEVFHDENFEDGMWWKDFMPEFRYLPAGQLPPGAKVGMSYKTVVLNPTVLLPWLRDRLEATGVRFQRANLDSLSDASSYGHDVLINASGFGSRFLSDVRDPDMEFIRGQTMLVRSTYSKMFMFDTGASYTYVIPLMDGTVVLGGTRDRKSSSPDFEWEVCEDIVRRIHENLPDHFPSDLADYDILDHKVGIRPGRATGIRVEKEVKSGQNVVHAYGFGGGGYIFSFGVARVARDLVEEFLFPLNNAES